MANELKRTWKESAKGQLQKRVALYFELQLTPRLNSVSGHEGSSEIVDHVSTQKLVEALAHDIYVPVNRMLIQRIKSDSSVKIAFAVSGQAIELLASYAPEVLDGLKALNETGAVEWLAFPYNNSLSLVVSDDVYREEVTRHSDILYEYFGVHPKTLLAAPFYGTSLMPLAVAMGFESVLLKGDAWAGISVAVDAHSDLVVLGTDPSVSDAVVHRFGAGEATLTLEEWVGLINRASSDTVVVGLPFEIFQLHREAGIGGFVDAFLARAAMQEKLTLPGDVARDTPHEIAGTFDSAALPDASNTERWLGSEIQRDALTRVTALNQATAHLVDHHDRRMWLQLLSADHFASMSTGESISNSYLSAHEAHERFNEALRLLGMRAATAPVNEIDTAAKAVEAGRQHPTTPNWAVQEQSRYQQITHSHI